MSGCDDLVGTEMPRVSACVRRDHSEELTGNTTQARGIEHFTEGLSEVYRAMSTGLKPGAPLAFTFHHNRIEPYHAVGVAILDANLACSATLPCPAEMGGSIHIHGTGSSIVDTIFVCRAEGGTREGQSFDDLEQLAGVMESELALLRDAGLKPSAGDIRCMVFGHLTRYAIGRLRTTWDRARPTADRLHSFGRVCDPGDYQELIDRLAAWQSRAVAGTLRQLPLFPRTTVMPFPFEVPFEQVQADLDAYVNAVFAGLQSEFMTLPKGPGFIEYPTFERGYEELKRVTGDFRDVTSSVVLDAVHRVPAVFIVLRSMLGFTPPEWAYVTQQRTSVGVTQGAIRSLDRKIG